MRVPLEWLHEYCNPGLDAPALAQALALSGTEVERVEHHGVSGVENFVVGYVVSREQHPNADRLSVCMVELGTGTPVQIVCGAPNVAAGQTVGVACPGSIMPDGTKLKVSKLRGLESNGMILAEDEVGIGVEHNGIMVLADGIAPGTPLIDVLPIATDVLELEITPNRPDCLGIYGVAREVAACTGAPLKPAPWEQDPGANAGGVVSAGIRAIAEGAAAARTATAAWGATAAKIDGLEIDNAAGPDLCPRFTARRFEGVTIGSSPYWLKGRLMAAGQRPISNVVDITNYVMLLTGQPMHAFDYEKIAGHKLTVRRAQAGEKVTTLDEVERTLDEQMVLIDDADGPTSIAGVMGGARSEVSDETTSVVTEVATWNGANIHRTSLELGLRSEASGRYEKQLQVEQTGWAQAVASQLLIDVCGAHQVGGTILLGDEAPAPITIHLRTARMAKLLGVEISAARATQLLQQIGFTVTPAAGDGLDVIVPDFRRDDVTREADLIEEVARLDGLDRLPATLPARAAAVGGLSTVQRARRKVVDAVAAQGLAEIVGWSFTNEQTNSRLRLTPELTARTVKIANPLSGDLSQLRVTLLGSLLSVAQYNFARGAERIRLFETGAVYLANESGELPSEPQHLAAILSGPARAASWRESAAPAADFFAAKSILASVLDTLGVEWSVTPGEEPFLHPVRSAHVKVSGEVVGWLGEIHPNVAAQWDLELAVAGFELDIDAIPTAAVRTYKDLLSYPELREDLAVVIDDSVSADAVIELILSAGRPLAVGAEVFDVYRDAERLGENKVSLAIRVRYRASDRTLTSAEVAKRREKIIAALKSELGGEIRGGQ